MNSTFKTRKHRFTFNFIDVLLLMVILAAVLVLVYIFASGNSLTADPTVTIEYQVLINGIRNEFCGLVSVGDKVIDSVGLFEIGEVVDVSYTPYMYPMTDSATGTISLVEYPEHSDMTLTIRAEATTDTGYYYINGYTVAVGVLVSVRTPNFVEQGYCTVISEVNSVEEE